MLGPAFPVKGVSKLEVSICVANLSQSLCSPLPATHIPVVSRSKPFASLYPTTWQPVCWQPGRITTEPSLLNKPSNPKRSHLAPLSFHDPGMPSWPSKLVHDQDKPSWPGPTSPGGRGVGLFTMHPLEDTRPRFRNQSRV